MNDGSYAAGCVVSTSENAGDSVEVGTVVTVYIAADPSVQITTTPEGSSSSGETAPPETPAEGAAEPEQTTNE